MEFLSGKARFSSIEEALDYIRTLSGQKGTYAVVKSGNHKFRVIKVSDIQSLKKHKYDLVSFVRLEE